MKRILLMLTLALVALVGCKKDPMPGQDATAFESPANCYIVSQAGTYSFKTVKGNSSESVGDVASAEVLWESFGTDVAPAVGDLISSVSYKDGKIVFKTTDKKGNAVIAAKDANGNILWSWHIWMTDQPQEQEYYNNAGTMMDRNLGATNATPGDVGALGLLYQWGRKDPFLGSSSISETVEAKSTITWPSAVSSDSSNGTIEYATANPTTFIINNINQDWYYTGSSSTDNTRWTTSVKAKSIYDPCPAGWRVPDGGENGVWAKLLGLEEINYPFDTTRKGMNFSGKFGSDQTIWYPFAGYYNRFEARLYFVGEYGSYWSASPCPGYDNLMYSLDLNPVIAIPDWDNVYPVDESRCATAMSVRCMKEGTAKTVKVSQIKLVGMPTTDFNVGCSVTISAVITPDDATDKSVTFTSSNPEVATVEYTKSENNYSLALLKAVSPGKATITATANDGSGVKAEAEVTVIPSTANCYIVSEQGTYSFKTVKGNSSKSVGDVASAEVLWESFGTDVAPAVGNLVKSVSYSNGKITYTATGRKGNAVIAAKDASGTILWSWHIWMTDQPQEQVYFDNAGTVMDRNLGATSATPGDVGALGLLYQWGRKDPFLGSSSISSSTVAKSTIVWPSAVSSDSSNGRIAYATAHPTTYITANEGNGDWYYTGSESTDDTRWTTSESNKSIYDPCPAGWRVPDGGDNGVWSKALGSSSPLSRHTFNSFNAGMNFSGKFGSASTIWYPASGYRRDSDGSLYIVGDFGCYWSAYPMRDAAYSLDFFYDGKVRLLYAHYRADGHSVRCIKE